MVERSCRSQRPLPIDAFILARLEAKNLKPSPEADRATYIRRVTLDALGYIPTPEEVKAFVNDRSPDAYERLVDRLLASPHYGERQARHWLDLARYADSAGFQNDQTRPNQVVSKRMVKRHGCAGLNAARIRCCRS